MFFGEGVAQVERFRIAIPGESRQLGGHRGHRFGRGSKRALVRSQTNKFSPAGFAHQLLRTDKWRRRWKTFNGGGEI